MEMQQLPVPLHLPPTAYACPSTYPPLMPLPLTTTGTYPLWLQTQNTWLLQSPPRYTAVAVAMTAPPPAALHPLMLDHSTCSVPQAGVRFKPELQRASGGKGSGESSDRRQALLKKGSRHQGVQVPEMHAAE